MRISDWSSDVCSSDLAQKILRRDLARHRDGRGPASLRRRPWPAGERAIHFGGIVAHAFVGVALLGERADGELLSLEARCTDFVKHGFGREVTKLLRDLIFAARKRPRREMDRIHETT